MAESSSEVLIVGCFGSSFVLCSSLVNVLLLECGGGDEGGGDFGGECGDLRLRHQNQYTAKPTAATTNNMINICVIFIRLFSC